MDDADVRCSIIIAVRKEDTHSVGAVHGAAQLFAGGAHGRFPVPAILFGEQIVHARRGNIGPIQMNVQLGENHASGDAKEYCAVAVGRGIVVDAGNVLHGLGQITRASNKTLKKGYRYDLILGNL